MRLTSLQAMLAIWAAYSLILTLAFWPFITTMAAQGADDYMRLLQVRDWMAGQSWFDVHQYRMDPPTGADMHWSRLVDLPIAAFLALFRLFLSETGATEAAMTAVPLVQLLILMALLRDLMQRLDMPRGAVLIGVAIVPMFPLLLSTFAPMRIDHHGWQGLAALACANALVAQGSRVAPWLCGGLCGIWLTISLEGLPLVAVLAGIYGLRHALWRQAGLAGFLAALTLAAAGFALATRRITDLLFIHCDTLSWPHMAAFCAAAVAALVAVRLPGRETVAGRFAALALVPIVALPMVVPMGRCATNPFANLDPVMQHYWYNQIYEGLPVTAQLHSTAVMLVWTLGMVAFGWWAMTGGRLQSLRRDAAWHGLGLYALAAAIFSLTLMRAGIAAQILAIPFCASLIYRYLPRARALPGLLPRVLATMACITLIPPTLAPGAERMVENLLRPTSADPLVAPVVGSADCDFTRLNQLPRGHMFATLDIAPTVLVQTTHTVVTGGYHRNLVKMREVIDAFSGDPAKAEALVRSNRSDYLVMCRASGETSVYAKRRADNLSSAIDQGHAPGWLVPVPGFADGALLVYRLR